MTKDYYELSKVKNALTEQEIEEHINEVDWDWISQYQKLSEAFIKKYANEVDRELISTYQKLLEDFMEYYVRQGVFV